MHSENGKCKLLADDWDMPERSRAICGCGFVAREHPRRPLLAPTPGIVLMKKFCDFRLYI